MRTITAVLGTTLAAATLAVGATGTANAAATSITGEGTYIVGVDIEPGLYVSAGAVDTDFDCWGTRLSGFSGEYDDAIAYVYGKDRVVVRIEPTDAAFDTWNCRTWTRLAETPAPAPAPAPDLTGPLVGSAVVGSAVVGSAALPTVVGLMATGS
ncbi:hypothetical protein [Prescottella sp. R16]|uniref:hypothetical protein n=1 Tax=Prescottella sp. R16 TaxID=3064529 RepID=UPI00272E811A|nr:hypothetical protein [Prescottella sp. R16]